MNEFLKSKILIMSSYMITWSVSWLLISIALLLAFIVIISPMPFMYHHEHTARESFVVFLRKLIMGTLICLVVLFPAFIFSAMQLRFPVANEAVNLFSTWLRSLRGWLFLPLALIVGTTVRIVSLRYIQPVVSAYWRSLRTTQHTESQSDIRDEISSLKSKDFDPRQYYRLDQRVIFMGLDEVNQPIYIELNAYLERNQLILGPTRLGKGVSIGCQLDQLIRMAIPVWYIDPKEDENIPFILAQAAKAMGRDFLYLDLNPGGYGLWSPFSGGKDRDKRARIINAFGLADTGSDADFYKLGERAILDEILDKTNGHLLSMLDTAKKYDDLKRLTENLKEWSRIDTFHTKTDGRAQFSVARCMENNAVVYVRGSIGDNIVKKATRVLIDEIVQESTRLKQEGKRDKHLVVAVDEVRFVISNELTNALATSLGFNVKFIVATQSIGDLRNLEDRSLNPAAIEQSFLINCQEKLIYNAADAITAEFASGLGGSKWITVVRSESTEVNDYGGEKWSDVRQINKVEEDFISENKLKSLPKRVAVLFILNQLAQPVFTCWVPVDRTIQLHKPLKVKENKVA